mgnify:CR=1 FL=1
MGYDNKRSRVLAEAMDLVNGQRNRDYGPPESNFRRIADGWSIILQTDVTPEMVAMCMAWLKMARLVNGPHEDSYVDAAAYMALAAELSEC